MAHELETEQLGVADGRLVPALRLGRRARVEQNVFQNDHGHVGLAAFEELLCVFEVEEDFAVVLVLLLQLLDHKVHLLLLDEVVHVPLALQVLGLSLAPPPRAWAAQWRENRRESHRLAQLEVPVRKGAVDAVLAAAW